MHAVAEGRMSDNEKHMDIGLVRLAMAFRVKYRVCQDKFIAVARMGVHQAKRGGQYPNADTVKNLLCKILKTGFSENEANHEGVCVESIPQHEPTAAAASYLKYNLLNATHAFYEKCFTPQDDVMYGLLSHNHLMIGLKCIQNGANWRLGDEWRSKVHVDGAWNCKAVEAVDAEIANVLKNGLRMEVLSWQIHAEEPTACSLISQAQKKS